jgi:hypothetical protein
MCDDAMKGDEEISCRTSLDKKTAKEKKEEECCGKHKECKCLNDARRIPSIKGGRK